MKTVDAEADAEADTAAVLDTDVLDTAVLDTDTKVVACSSHSGWNQKLVTL